MFHWDDLDQCPEITLFVVPKGESFPRADSSFDMLLDYEQSLFFLSASTEARETPK